ncbi:MAG: hypothetical protein MZV64_09740 [Ignavibacteriales bacterium]|nr:hypothetical protein [Ignavibacteriales bacterium]
MNHRERLGAVLHCPCSRHLQISNPFADGDHAAWGREYRQSRDVGDRMDGEGRKGGIPGRLSQCLGTRSLTAKPLF